MPSYTAYYESFTPDNSARLPVSATADSLRDAVKIFHEWRGRQSTTVHDMISLLPYAITRDEFYTDDHGTRQFREVVESGDVTYL